MTEKKQELQDKPAKTSAVDSIVSQMDLRGFAALGSVNEMRKKLDEYRQKRDLILSYIKEAFVENIDYGPADPRNPKKTLLKPGAEKVCRMFDTHAEWEIDEKTALAVGARDGTVCMICRIVDNRTGAVIGEGRGAERVGNKQRDANKAIKAAEKCALVDAALYTFMLSEFFTQDDAGRGQADLKTQGQLLLDEIAGLRKGTDSGISDIKWLCIVNLREINRKDITTQGQMDHMRRVIVDERKYDFVTGERIPGEINAAQRGN